MMRLRRLFVGRLWICPGKKADLYRGVEKEEKNVDKTKSDRQLINKLCP